MNLKEIIAVSGYSGLFKLIAKGKTNIIVESLVDGKRMPVFANDKANALADIAVFTTNEDMPLAEVFKKIFIFQDKKEITIDFKKNQKEMVELFEQILPEYDKERVYPSDIKKIFSWYNLLLKHNLIDLEEENKEEVKKKDQTVEQKVEAAETKEANSIKEKKEEESNKSETKRTPRKKKTTEQ